jgi:branched-chain amino acid transport system ATP-binding protein
MALLEVQEVSHRFGGNVVLDRVTLAADEGRITGLIGPNGAGKSTLFDVVTGALDPTRGRVVLAGQDLGRCSVHRRARLGIGRTFQRLEPFGSLTVRDSVRLAAAVSRHDRRDGLLEPDTIIRRLGLERVAGVRTDTLPTGQSRLAELGRALATGPRLLLLDEPASGLDDGETEQLADVLAAVAGSGIGVLLVEHDMGLVMRACAQIHVLDHGVLIASGAPGDIRADPRVRASYLGDGSLPRRPIIVREAAMPDAPTTERLARLDAGLDDARAGRAPDRNERMARAGGALLALGVVLAVVAYFLSHRTTDPLVQNDAVVVAIGGLCVAVAGAALYVRHGLAAALRRRG